MPEVPKNRKGSAKKVPSRKRIPSWISCPSLMWNEAWRLEPKRIKEQVCWSHFLRKESQAAAISIVSQVCALRSFKAIINPKWQRPQVPRVELPGLVERSSQPCQSRRDGIKPYENQHCQSFINMPVFSHAGDRPQGQYAFYFESPFKEN